MRSNVAVIDDSNEYNKSQEQHMQRIPDLELYIVNVFNPKENDINIREENIVPQKSQDKETIKLASGKGDEEESNESDYDEDKDQLEEEQEEPAELTSAVITNQIF